MAGGIIDHERERGQVERGVPQTPRGHFQHVTGHAQVGPVQVERGPITSRAATGSDSASSAISRSIQACHSVSGGIAITPS